MKAIKLAWNIWKCNIGEVKNRRNGSLNKNSVKPTKQL